MENQEQPIKENHIDNARALSIRDLLKYVPEDEVRANLANHFDDEEYIEKLMTKAKRLASDAERKTAFNAFESEKEDRREYWKQVDRDRRETHHTDYGRNDDYAHDAKHEFPYVAPGKISTGNTESPRIDAAAASKSEANRVNKIRQKQADLKAYHDRLNSGKTEGIIDEESSIPYALTLLPMLSDREQAVRYLQMLRKKYDLDFAKAVLMQATEFKKGQESAKMKEDGAQQATVDKVDTSTNSVTLNNKDGTKTVAPTAMLMKDPTTGKLMLNKPKVTPGTQLPSVSTTSLKPSISTGMTVNVADDINDIRRLSGL